MEKQQLKEFFASRPSLSKRGFCREAGISDTLLDRILFRGGTLTDNVADKLAPVLNKYGGSFDCRQYLKVKLCVPDNWDKHDFNSKLYSFNDIESVFDCR